MTSKDKPEQIFPRPLSGDDVTRQPSCLIPERTPLIGRFADLQPQNAAIHAPALYEAGHGSEQALKIWDYLAYGPWQSLDAYTATLKQQSSSFDPIFYTICNTTSGKACGQASFLDIHPQNGVIEIGHIWFSPELQRTRGATEALFMMLKYAMDDLGYRRMQWRCNSLNEKSRQAARRLGFRFEGIFYNHMIFKGKNRDTSWYSILDSEWPEVRDIIESWLDDSNFDTNNTAKSSLFQKMQKRNPDAGR